MEKTTSVTKLQSYLSSQLSSMIGARCAVTDRLLWCQQNAYIKKHPTCKNPESIEDAEGKVIQRKVDDLYSWMIDLVVRQFYDLFRVKPTPVPDIKDDHKEIIADKVLDTVKDIIKARSEVVIPAIINEYASLGISINPEQALELAEKRKLIITPTESEIRDIVNAMKELTRQYEMEEAERSSSLMFTQLKDYLHHGHSLAELQKFLLDFCIFPYAVMCSSDSRFVNMKRWNGNKLTTQREIIPYWRRVSPFDFYWTKDSTDTHNGIGIAERFPLRLFEIQEYSQRKNSIKKNIDWIINNFDKRSLNWLASSKENKEEALGWLDRPADTIDVFRLMLRMPTKVLMDLFDNSFDPNEIVTVDIPDSASCEVEAYICADKIIELTIHDYKFVRPYEKECFIAKLSSFEGDALPEKLSMTNAASRKTFIHTIRNLGRSTSPSLFVNMNMFEDDELEDVLPDSQYRIFPPVAGAGRNPVDILNYPNYTNILIAFMNYLDDQADKDSGIPRYALGNADNMSSALRSAEALTTMISNALKTITSRIYRIGTNVIAPCGARMIEWVMVNNPDEALKYDAELKVEGIEGVVVKGIVQKQISELLQYLAPFANNGMVDPEYVTKLIDRYIKESGIEHITPMSKIMPNVEATMGLRPIPPSVQQPQQPQQPMQPEVAL